MAPQPAGLTRTVLFTEVAAMATPNILHISWHDTGRHFGCYGIESVHTPNVDRLAAEGVLFANAFSSAAVCSPSRGACLTGRFPQSNGLIHLCHGNFGYRLNDAEKHLAQLLGERGYHTVLAGFQHEVDHRELARLGFHQTFCTDPAPPIYPIPPCEVVASETCAFLEKWSIEQSDRPLYLQLGFFETHRPYSFGGCEPDDSRGVTVPPYLVSDVKAVRDHAALQGSIRKADAALGMVLEKLRELGLDRNTLVLFAPDHGLANPRAKATVYDPGIQIAWIMRWPDGGLQPGTRSEALVSNVDFVPTLFDLCGWEAPGNLQGTSFAGSLRNTGDDAGRTEIFALHHDGDVRCVRTRTHKLIRNFSKLREYSVPVEMGGTAHPILQETKGVKDIGAVELYDLVQDPLETNNLADTPECRDVQANLDAKLWAWMEEAGDPLLKGGYTTPRHALALRGRR